MTFLRSHIRSYLIAACICFFILQFFNRIEYPVNSAEIELYMAPADSIGQEPMPLITLGDGRAYGGFFLQKLAPDRGRVGYFSSQGSILYSDPFSITAGTLHKVHISMQELVRKASLNVSVDGTRVLGTSLACPNITSTQHVIGQNQVIQGLAKQFNGILLPANSPTLERVNYPFGISPYLAPLTIAALMLALVYLCLQNFLRTLALPPAVIYIYIFCLFTYIAQVTDWTFAILYPDVGLASFYDYQLQSLLQGHWDVPFQAISYEAYVIDGKYYGYFGPTPAFIRLPLTAFKEMYGYWTRLAMTIAHAITLAFLLGCTCNLWKLFFKNKANSIQLPVFIGCILVLLYQFGTATFFISSSASIYFEAISWATMFATISVYYTTLYIRTENNFFWFISIIFGTLSTLSRVTIGAYAIILLGCITLYIEYYKYTNRQYGIKFILKPIFFKFIIIFMSLLSFHQTVYIKFNSFQFPQELHIQMTPKRLELNGGKSFSINNIEYNMTSYFFGQLIFTKEYPYIYATSLDPQQYQNIKIDKLVFADRGECLETVPGLIYTATAALILTLISIIFIKKFPLNFRIFILSNLLCIIIILIPLSMAISNNYRYINDISIPLSLVAISSLMIIKTKTLSFIICIILAMNMLINIALTSYNTGIYFTSSQESKDHYVTKSKFKLLYDAL